MLSRMTRPGKKALFQVTAEAAASLDVEESSMTIDTGNAELQRWIPSLEIGRIRAVVGKTIAISSTSRRRGRAMTEVSRRRLESWIPEDAHRGLRMLRQRELLVNVVDLCGSQSVGLTACAVVEDITLNIGRIRDMIVPVVGKLVNSYDDGPFDMVALPLLEVSHVQMYLIILDPH